MAFIFLRILNNSSSNRKIRVKSQNQNENFKLAEILMGDPNIEISIKDWEGFSALDYAFKYNKTQVVEKIINHPKFETQELYRSFHTLVAENKLEIIDLYLNHPDFDLSKANYQEAFKLATNNGSSDILTRLIDKAEETDLDIGSTPTSSMSLN